MRRVCRPTIPALPIGAEAESERALRSKSEAGRLSQKDIFWIAEDANTRAYESTSGAPGGGADAHNGRATE